MADEGSEAAAEEVEVEVMEEVAGEEEDGGGNMVVIIIILVVVALVILIIAVLVFLLCNPCASADDKCKKTADFVLDKCKENAGDLKTKVEGATADDFCSKLGETDCETPKVDGSKTCCEKTKTEEAKTTG